MSMIFLESPGTHTVALFWADGIHAYTSADEIERLLGDIVDAERISHGGYTILTAAEYAAYKECLDACVTDCEQLIDDLVPDIEMILRKQKEKLNPRYIYMWVDEPIPCVWINHYAPVPGEDGAIRLVSREGDARILHYVNKAKMPEHAYTLYYVLLNEIEGLEAESITIEPPADIHTIYGRPDPRHATVWRRDASICYELIPAGGPEWWTRERLWDLRDQIKLGSPHIPSYRNMQGVDQEACCNFFLAYLDRLRELGEADGIPVGAIMDSLKDYDTPENLEAFYGSFAAEGKPDPLLPIVGNLSRRINP